MSRYKKSRSDGGTSERETVNDGVKVHSQGHRNTKRGIFQVSVSDFLMNGEKNAIRAQKLCKYLGLDSTRTLRLAVERERADGALILSSTNGYYLPSDTPAEARLELQDFVRRTDARMMSNRVSVRAARAALKNYTGEEIDGQEALF